MGALRARGMRVAAFKCGPDYLDPTYHRRAAGVSSHNLDGWMMDRASVLATFARAAEGADIAVIEGMMGLFDGAAPTSDEGSSAEIAKWLAAPVLLVVDASGMARTVAAVAHGFSHFDPRLKLAGLICNRVGSRGHLDLLRAASAEVPVLGGFPSEARLAFPERHLGLLSADDKSVAQPLFDAWAGIGGAMARPRRDRGDRAERSASESGWTPRSYGRETARRRRDAVSAWPATTPSISTTKTTCAGWRRRAPNWCVSRRRARRDCPRSTDFISAAAIPKRSPPSFPAIAR